MDFDDLLALGQFEHEFEVPGREKTHTIRVGVLWQKDLVRIKDRAARRVVAGDTETRREIELMETLVESILAIDGQNFYDSDNLINHDSLKSQLRGILEKANPYVITYIYSRYIDVVEMARKEVDDRIKEIKKSSGSSQQTTINLS